MRKVVLASALAVFALASCKKEYTCECTVSLNGSESGSSNIIINDTKRKADKECENNETSAVIFGVNTSTSCELID